MTHTAEEIINSFDRLAEHEKREVTLAILRRTVDLDLPPLTDEDLVVNAEQVFLELDRREAEDGQPQ